MKFIFIASILFNVLYCQQYRGAELRTLDSFLYGRFDARFKPAQGDGLVSSFFTYNDDNPNTPWAEIDVEVLGVYHNVVDFNTITRGQDSHIRQHYVDFNPHLNFHTYSFEWTPDYVAWFIDNEEVYRQTGSHIDSLYVSQKIMMNIWNPVYVDWVGAWNSEILPRFSFYDYVSYSAYTPGMGDSGTESNFTFSWKDDFDTFDYNRWEKSDDHTWGGNQSLFIDENIHFENGNLILCLTDEDNTGYVDNHPPKALWARQNENILTVRYSEEIDESSGVELNNYSLSGVSFTNALMHNDQRTVDLTMDQFNLSSTAMGIFNAQDDSDNIASTNIVWIDIPQPLGDTIKINTGGGQSGDFLQDQIWGPDKEYGHVAGNFQFVSDDIDIQNTDNTDNDDIYRSSLNRVALYKIRVKPGIYSLALSFSENHYDNAGDRVFDIFVEGNLKVDGLDVLDHVPAFSLYNINFDNIEVLDGVLDIHLSADIYGVGYGAAGTFINGIEVVLENSLSNDTNVAKEFSLQKPYPNPFNNNISIPIISNVKSYVLIEIFDINGRKVETVFNGIALPGETEFKWDANLYSSGTYLIHLIINGDNSYEKIMLIK